MRHLLLTLLLALTAAAHAQTDNDYILHTKTSLMVKNCDEAANSLIKVSAAGKITADYYFCMGNVSDCKQNKEQALYYYGKYLEMQPGSDSVKKRVAELKDQKTQEAKAADEMMKAKYLYQAAGSKNGKVKKKKKAKHMSISDNFSLTGLSYDMGIGGDNAPYKSAINLSFAAQYPIAHNRVLLGYSIGYSYLFAPNRNWFAKVYSIQSEQVSVGMGMAANVLFTPSAVLVNKRKLSLTVGPDVGFGFFYTPENSSIWGGGTFDDQMAWGVCYGLRSNLFIGRTLGFYVAYSSFSRKQVSLSRPGAVGMNSEITPVNHDMIQLGISVRFDDWWWGRGWW